MGRRRRSGKVEEKLHKRGTLSQSERGLGVVAREGSGHIMGGLALCAESRRVNLRIKVKGGK